MATQLIGKVVGPPGEDGADGADAVITGASASASALQPGSSPTATVTTGGTPGSRSFAFAFGIPRGEKGDPGEDGADGADGSDGAPGAPGPNEVTATTATDLNGVLAGNGATVGVKTVDSSPDASHTGNLITSAAVATALAAKPDWSEIATQQTTNAASKDYHVGDYYYYTLNNRLYRITAEVRQGETLANGTNCERATMGDGLVMLPRNYKVVTNPMDIQLHSGGYLLHLTRGGNANAALYSVNVTSAGNVYMDEIFNHNTGSYFSVAAGTNKITVTPISGTIIVNIIGN